jgi:hypothetical protein
LGVLSSSTTTANSQLSLSQPHVKAERDDDAMDVEKDTIEDDSDSVEHPALVPTSPKTPKAVVSDAEEDDSHSDSDDELSQKLSQ